MINEEIKKNYSMKILFGPMFGCELHLPADDYFLIINSGLALLDKNTNIESTQEHAAHYTKNTLYIPCDVVSPNITLHLPEPTTQDGQTLFDIEIHNENGKDFTLSFQENEVFIHEHIKFSIKCSDKPWSDEVKNYSGSLPIEDQKIIANKKTFKNKKRIAGILFGILIIIISLSIFSYQRIFSDRQVITLSDALSGAPAPLEIVKGRESKDIYIIAHKFQEMAWAKEAINKLKKQKNLTLILLSNLRRQIIDELSSAGFPVLQLDYSTPTYPVLAIYRTLTDNEEIRLRALFLQKSLFSQDVKFIIKTKEQLIKEARYGLDRLNIHYRQINTASGYSLVIRDALSDNILNTLRNFIGRFSQQWGNTVITFSINLDENWLQNKSYVDSSSGYLFLNPRHWYFPLNNKEF